MTVLKFTNLSELAAYSKSLSVKGYLINVQTLTLQCLLSKIETKLALEQYGATVTTNALVES